MTKRLDRREFLAVSAAAGVLAAAPLARAKEPKIAMRTFTYKKVGDLEIKADVYRPDDDKVRPVAMWIHGGALIMGSRSGVSKRFQDPLLAAGYAVVSIDYRLAPETKLPEILKDVEDAYTWLHEKGPSLFQVDTSKIIVAGGSAGGYLTLSAGFRAKPRPAALVAFWGYGELTSAWYARPSEFYRKQPLVKEDEAFAAVRGGPVVDSSVRPDARSKFYLYCRQQGVWPKLVVDIDPVAGNKSYDPFCPARNVTKDYPPTLLIHGDEDTDVPYEQSVIMAREFKRNGVPHQLVTVPRSGHGLSGGDPKLVDAAYESVLPFIKKHA